MKKFTKGLMTLALLVLGLSNVYAGEETSISERDWTTTTEYPYYWMGDEEKPNFCKGTATVQIVDGALQISNTVEQANNWDLQPFVLDWFNIQEQYGYRIEVTMKSDVEGKANLSFGTWGGAENAELSFEATTDFVKYSATIAKTALSTSGNDAHVLFQMGKVVGTVYIQKVELIEITPDEPIREPVWTEILINGDLTGTDMSCFYSKEYPAPDPQPANIVDGVIVVESAAKVKEDWDTQFWIRLPQALAPGKKFKVSFDYKASSAQECGTQIHREPGDYKTWQGSIGNIAFDTDWKTFDGGGKPFTVSADGAGNLHSIAFNLTKSEDVTYYFRNFSLQIDDIDITENDFPAAVSVPCAVSQTGWASFSSDKHVAFGKAKAYGAKYDATSGTVKLTEIDELPAGEGALIKTDGKAALYQFTILSDAPASSLDNELKAGSAMSNGTYYALTTNSLGESGFAKVKADVEIPEGKAYLEIPELAREFIGLFETTGIKTVGVAESNEVIFNLAGQRLMKAQKGVNVINGKKLFVK